MKKFSFLTVVLFFGVQVLGQSFEQELKDAIATKPRFEIRLDSRHSFINQSGVKVFGVKAGVQFDNKLSFGLGYNRLWSPLDRSLEMGGALTNVQLGFFHVSPYVEYVFFRDKQWELSIPVQFGFGQSFYKRKEDGKKLNERFVISYEPAITFQYRFLRYFGAGLGIGYRLMLKPNRALEETFTSPVYIFKTKVYFQEILKDLGLE